MRVRGWAEERVARYARCYMIERRAIIRARHYAESRARLRR